MVKENNLYSVLIYKYNVHNIYIHIKCDVMVMSFELVFYKLNEYRCTILISCIPDLLHYFLLYSD